MTFRERAKGGRLINRGIRTVCLVVLAASVGIFQGTFTHADETCMSPYMAKITGVESDRRPTTPSS